MRFHNEVTSKNMKSKFEIYYIPLVKRVSVVYNSFVEKIAFFRSLFAGREDVFARRWYSKTTGKSGYQPVCENEWVPGLCDKKTYKCADCPNRQLHPLDYEAIFAHLAGKDEYGRDVVGVYPMLTDDTCRFLAADFDEENFKDDVSA